METNLQPKYEIKLNNKQRIVTQTVYSIRVKFNICNEIGNKNEQTVSEKNAKNLRPQSGMWFMY